MVSGGNWLCTDLEVTAQHWSQHSARFSGRNTGLFWWEAGPAIQEHINRSISGSPDVDWVAYTLRKYFNGRLPLDRCLSLGCGTGHLERHLARLGTFRHCDAFDIAESSVRIAEEHAKAESFDCIAYHVADVNSLVLAPDSYDAVWIHSAMHHFHALEGICRELKHAIRPEGLLVMNEYIGPSRFQFSPRQREVINLCLHLLPMRYRFDLLHMGEDVVS